MSIADVCTRAVLSILERRNTEGAGLRRTPQRNVTADVAVIPIQKVRDAHERLMKSDVK